MGFGSTKTKIYVASTAVNLVSDNSPKTALNTAIQAALGGTGYTEDFIGSLTNGILAKSNRAYRYARDHYTHGLPEGHMEVGKGDDNLVRPILEALEGSAVQIIYNILDQGNIDPFAYAFMALNRGWSADDNIATQHPFTITEQGAGPLGYKEARFISSTSLEITYEYGWQYSTYEAGEWGNQEETVHSGTETRVETVAVTDLQLSQVYYHVNYVLVDGQGVPTSGERYWNYRVSSNVYPSLTVEQIQETSPFYPIVPLRWNNQDMAREEVRDTELYQTSKKLLGMLGIDILDLAEGINDNPDVGDIDHAFMFFGVGLQTQNAAGKRYLAEFFAYLEGLSAKTQRDYTLWELQTSKTKRALHPPINRLTIQDAGLKIDLTYNYIHSRVEVGSIGKVGTVIRSNTVLPRGAVTKTDIEDSGQERVTTYYTYERSSITFKRQLTKRTYMVTTVMGLEHINYVYGSHTVETSIGDSVDPDDDNFIVPLNKFVVDQLSYHLKSDLHYDTLRLVLNSYEKVKVKWYAQTWFKVVVIIASMIIMAYTGYNPMAGFADAVAAGAMATLEFLVTQIAFAMAVDYGFSLLVKMIGIEAAIIAAMILVAYSVQLPSSVECLKGLPFADQLLFVANGLVAGIQGNIQDEMEDLMEESEDFKDESEEKTDALEAANKLLETSDIIDPFTFIQPTFYFDPDETPEMFYTRTVHAGNVGSLAIEAISEYVGLMLQLPTTREIIDNDLGAV